MAATGANPAKALGNKRGEDLLRAAGAVTCVHRLCTVPRLSPPVQQLPSLSRGANWSGQVGPIFIRSPM